MDCPGGIARIDGTLSLTDRENVILRGIGASHPLFSGPPQRGTVFKRVSGTGAMLNWSANAAPEWLKGNGIEGIAFDCNGLATTGINLASHFGGTFRNIHVHQSTSVGISLTTVSLAGVEDLQACIFENISINTAATSGKGMTWSSWQDGGGNVSLNKFGDLHIYTNTGTALEVGDSDHNYVDMFRCNTTSGLMLDILGSRTSTSNGNASFNYFAYVNGNGGVTSRATGVPKPAFGNHVVLDGGNGNSFPTVEPGSSLSVFWLGTWNGE